MIYNFVHNTNLLNHVFGYPGFFQFIVVRNRSHNLLVDLITFVAIIPDYGMEDMSSIHGFDKSDTILPTACICKGMCFPAANGAVGIFRLYNNFLRTNYN